MKVAKILTVATFMLLATGGLRPSSGSPRTDPAPGRADDPPDAGPEPTREQLAWLRGHAIPFATDEPGRGLDDLEPLRAIVGDARIVALGEATHGTAEFFRMKHRIVEFLATRLGFTIFAIEANMPEAYRVNEYVLTGRGDPKALLKGMYFWTWDTQEVLDMIEWMRRFNASGKGRIEFTGFDMQTPTVAARNARAFVARADPEYLEEAGAVYKDLDAEFAALRQPGPDAPKDNERRQALARRARAVVEHLEAGRDRYAKGLPAGEVDRSIQDARVAAQAATMLAKSGGNGEYRDLCMADNVDWILDHAPKGTRVVLWAHNGHVARKLPWDSMGTHLARRHGDDYRVLGFAFHQGRYTAIGRGTGLGTHDAKPSYPGSLEWFFHRSGMPRCILDLRAARADDPASSWLLRERDHQEIGALAMESGFRPAKVAEQFDALIFFDETSPSTVLRPKDQTFRATWAPTGRATVPETGDWKVVFSDDFEREVPGERWKPTLGRWTIRDGHLHGELTAPEGMPGVSGALVTPEGLMLPERVELRFSCRSRGEVSCQVFLSDPETRSSLALTLLGVPHPDLLADDGSRGAKGAALWRFDAEGGRKLPAGNPQFVLTPDEWHKVRLVRDGHQVTVVVDGAVVLTATVEPPLPKGLALTNLGATRGAAGTAIAFDDVQVRTP